MDLPSWLGEDLGESKQEDENLDFSLWEGFFVATTVEANGFEDQPGDISSDVTTPIIWKPKLDPVDLVWEAFTNEYAGSSSLDPSTDEDMLDWDFQEYDSMLFPEDMQGSLKRGSSLMLGLKFTTPSKMFGILKEVELTRKLHLQGSTLKAPTPKLRTQVQKVNTQKQTRNDLLARNLHPNQMNVPLQSSFQLTISPLIHSYPIIENQDHQFHPSLRKVQAFSSIPLLYPEFILKSITTSVIHQWINDEEVQSKHSLRLEIDKLKPALVSEQVKKTVLKEFKVVDRNKRLSKRTKKRRDSSKSFSDWQPVSIYQAAYTCLDISRKLKSTHALHVPYDSCFGLLNLRCKRAWTRGPNVEVKKLKVGKRST